MGRHLLASLEAPECLVHKARRGQKAVRANAGLLGQRATLGLVETLVPLA